MCAKVLFAIQVVPVKMGSVIIIAVLIRTMPMVPVFVIAVGMAGTVKNRVPIAALMAVVQKIGVLAIRVGRVAIVVFLSAYLPVDII